MKVDIVNVSLFIFLYCNECGKNKTTTVAQTWKFLQVTPLEKIPINIFLTIKSFRSGTNLR